MHKHINISRLIGWIICLVLPLRLEAQEQSKAFNTEWEQQSPAKDTVLMNDILRLGDRAVKDNVISQKECISVMEFIRDSLPESTDLRIAILKQIRDEMFAHMQSLPIRYFVSLCKKRLDHLVKPFSLE